MLALVWIAAANAAGTCPSTNASLGLLVVRSEEAFQALDNEAFRTSIGSIHLAVACLSEPIEPRLAARVHRMEGLSAFLQYDNTHTSAFQAAVALDPAPLPSTFAPPGHPIARAYEAARGIETTTEPVVVPSALDLFADGTQSATRPTNRDVILQLVEHGTVNETVELRPGDPFSVAARGSSDEGDREHHGRAPLWVGLGTSAVLSGSALALSTHYRAQFFDTTTPYQDLGDLETRADALAITGGAFGALGASFGGALALSW